MADTNVDKETINEETRLALKASFVVNAGVAPNEAIAEFSRQWQYTVEDYEFDKAQIKEGVIGITRFQEKRACAEEFARALTDPTKTNWVNLTFTWY